MDEYGLPMMGPSVDYTKAAPLDGKSVQSMINEFLVRSTSFLNAFSTRCEQELSSMESNLQRIDTTLLMLEDKLDSVDDLGEVEQQPSAPVSSEVDKNPSESTQTASQSAAQAVESEQAPTSAPTSAPISAKSAIISVSRDPAFARYFKMLHFGVPAQAVKGKMLSEGVVPDLLDDPNAPTPNGLTENDLQTMQSAGSDRASDEE